MANQLVENVEAKLVTRKNLRDLLYSDYMKGELAKLLPKHLTAEKMIGVAERAASRNPKLLECTATSIAKSIVESATLGLMPDGTLGQAYLVPFWNGKNRCLEAILIVGYRGLITLARNTGEIGFIRAEVVYECEADHFEYILGHQPMIRHVRNLKVEPDDDKIVGAYFVGKLRGDDSVHSDFMTRSQLLSVMQSSPSKTKDGTIVGPWTNYFGEMCRKTLVRRGTKYLPMSVESPLARALDHEDKMDDQLSNLLDVPDAPEPENIIDGKVTSEEEQAPQAGAAAPEPLTNRTSEPLPDVKSEEGNQAQPPASPQNGKLNQLW